MKLTKKELANYLGVHRNTVTKYYNMYLDLKTSKSDFLTAYDVAQLDDVSLDFVLSRLR